MAFGQRYAEGAEMLLGKDKSLPKLTFLPTIACVLCRSPVVFHHHHEKSQLQSAFTGTMTFRSTRAGPVGRGRQSVGQAYAPYSHFQVGAALLWKNSVILRGNNQRKRVPVDRALRSDVAILCERARIIPASILSLAVPLTQSLHVNKPITPWRIADKRSRIPSTGISNQSGSSWWASPEKSWSPTVSSISLPYEQRG